MKVNSTATRHNAPLSWFGLAFHADGARTWVIESDEVHDWLRAGEDHKPAPTRPVYEERRGDGTQRSALKEEVTFDNSKVTSTNWSRYKILTMSEIPEIRVVQLSRDDKGFGGGSEGANALVSPAVAAALFDATGVHARRIPLTPKYLSNLLKI